MVRQIIITAHNRLLALIIACFFGLSALLTPIIHAAELSLAPDESTYSVGTTFSVRVDVGSAQEAMNAAGGVVTFPTDVLEVVSISKAGSVFNLWVQEPTFSNNTGEVTFEGIVLNPGYSGSGVTIITIRFRAKAPGKATLNFSNASVLANDGQGTNILESAGDARFAIVPAVSTPKPPIVPKTQQGPLVPPTITNYPVRMSSPAQLKVGGRSEYSTIRVELFLQRDNADPVRYEILSDENGNFDFVSTRPLGEGPYTLWAEVIDERGVRSEPSEQVMFSVDSTETLPKKVNVLTYYLVIALFFLALIAVLLYALPRRHRRKLGTGVLDQKHLRETRTFIKMIFSSLRGSVRSAKKELSAPMTMAKRERTERATLRRLKDDIKEAEEEIIEKVAEIEEE